MVLDAFVQAYAGPLRVQIGIVRPPRGYVPKTDSARRKSRLSKLHSLRQAAPQEPAFAVVEGAGGTAGARRLSAIRRIAGVPRIERTRGAVGAIAKGSSRGPARDPRSTSAIVITSAKPTMRAIGLTATIDTTDTIAITESKRTKQNDRDTRRWSKDRCPRSKRHKPDGRRDRASGRAGATL